MITMPEPDHTEDQRRTEVGLDEDEQRPARRRSHRCEEDAQRLHVLFVVGEEFRQHDHGRHLRDLDGCTCVPKTTIQRARAVRAGADHQHEHAAPRSNDVEREAQRAERAVVERAKHEHRHEADRGEHELARHRVRERLSGRAVRRQAAAVDEQRAVDRQADRGEQHQESNSRVGVLRRFTASPLSAAAAPARPPFRLRAVEVVVEDLSTPSGAASVAPTPRSRNTVTAICGLSAGREAAEPRVRLVRAVGETRTELGGAGLAGDLQPSGRRGIRAAPAHGLRHGLAHASRGSAG